ncbi:hypothetical protein D3C87_2147720 [compost metagenome]
MPASAFALYLARDFKEARMLSDEMASSGFALLNARTFSMTATRSAASPFRMAMA